MVVPVNDAPDDLGSVLTELASLLVDERSLPATLQLVADLAVRVVEPCEAAAVTLLRGNRYQTAAYTDDRILGFDRAQFETGSGPWVDARRELRTVIGEVAVSWPPLMEAARQLGVRSLLAAPLLRGGECIGALNFYGSRAHAFDDVDQRLVELFVSQAAVALANTRVYQDAVRLTEQLQMALTARVVIEQAKGILIALRGVTPEEAFDLLRASSQQRNEKLRDVAEQVVRSRGEIPALR